MHSWFERLALEFDAIRRERDEVAEKLAEAAKAAVADAEKVDLVKRTIEVLEDKIGEEFRRASMFGEQYKAKARLEEVRQWLMSEGLDNAISKGETRKWRIQRMAALEAQAKEKP